VWVRSAGKPFNAGGWAARVQCAQLKFLIRCWFLFRLFTVSFCLGCERNFLAKNYHRWNTIQNKFRHRSCITLVLDLYTPIFFIIVFMLMNASLVSIRG